MAGCLPRRRPLPTVPRVAEKLATSEVQVIAMLRRGEIRALQLGRRRQWRIERAEPEAHIQRCYEEIERETKQRGH